jgi:Arc/MetJ-type ribon-helix-helix transcriptional regulator
LRRGVVGVRSFEDAVQDREVTRRENTVFGSVGVPPKRGAVSDGDDGEREEEQKAAVRRGRGRPRSVDASERVYVRMSAQLYDELEALRRRHDVNTSEVVRFALKLLVNSPEDMLRAIREDPEAVRTVPVRRRITASRASAEGPRQGALRRAPGVSGARGSLRAS